jgi:ribonuclease P protein component
VTTETNDEKDISAEQPAPAEDARLPHPDEDQRRPRGAQRSSAQGEEASGRLTAAAADRAVSRFSFTSLQRIRLQSDFEKVYRGGRRIDAVDFVIYYRSNDRSCDRLGLSVARRRIGKAVRRNRAKRVIRELFRRNPYPVTPEARRRPAVDLVAVPLASLLDATFNELTKRWQGALREIEARLSRR